MLSFSPKPEYMGLRKKVKVEEANFIAISHNSLREFLNSSDYIS